MRKLPHIPISLFLFVVVSSCAAWAQSGPDNRYCGAGNHAQFSAKDGPAALPQACLFTAISGTPSPGRSITVSAGDDLQAAINSVQCGDTVLIQADAAFIGNFTLPNRHCSDSSWITIRSAADNSLLPAEGTRITPCYAGVASLPGRPDFGCTNPQRVIPKIMSANTVSPITLAANANHYRLMALELTRDVGTGFVARMVTTDPGHPADHLIVDRVWAHGTPQDDTRTAVGFSGFTYAAVVDSYMNDFHCTSVVGACTDSHAISGGVGKFPGGPFKVVNNFVEAAGENIMFGGGPSDLTPTDIEIRRNHMFKPMTWMKGQPGYVGGPGGRPFVVKNLMELKNAQRVLIEGNVLENSWGGFTQNGRTILLTPKNQIEGHKATCPLCQVVDVTVRYSWIRHAGGGLSIDATLTGKHKKIYQAKAAERYSIHDIIIDGIDPVLFNGGGSLIQIINGWPRNPLNTISINHITGFGDSQAQLLSVLDSNKNPEIENFAFTNNLVLSGRYPIWSAGGKNNCASSVEPVKNLNRCFGTYSFASNGIIASPPQFPPSSWPSKNDFPATPDDVQFVNYNNGNGGDYHLQPSSPYKNTGTDGKDLGADIDGLLSAIAGVE